MSAATKHLIILSASYKANRASGAASAPASLLPMPLLLLRITNVVRTTAANPFACCFSTTLRRRTHRSSPAGTKPFDGFTTARAWGSADNRLATLEFLYVAVADVVRPSARRRRRLGVGVRTCAPRRGGQVAPPHRQVLSRLSEETLGVPEYLLDGGLRMNSYTEHGGGKSPDYFNETLIETVIDFVGRFGARYDNDTRIGFVQIGMLGFWGEWHTYPHTAWFPPQATQNRIFDAYLEAFPTTLLMQRYPSVGGTSVRPRLGLFDDSFAYSTLSDKQSLQWYFWPRVLAAGQEDFWKSSPMGGELRPELQRKIFATDRSQYVLSDDKQAWNKTVDTTHVSWLLNHYAFSGTPDATERFVTNVAEQRMGYELWVSRVEVKQTAEGTLLVNVTLKNAGVAPFYYYLALSVKMELLAASGTSEHTVGDGRGDTCPPGRYFAVGRDNTRHHGPHLDVPILRDPFLELPKMLCGQTRAAVQCWGRCDDRWHQALCRGEAISLPVSSAAPSPTPSGSPSPGQFLRHHLRLQPSLFP